MIEATETALELDENKRKRTILRIDSGGGSVDDLNWVLERGYQVSAKDYSGLRAHTLAKTVSQWIPDTADNSREIGWITTEDTPYIRPVKRIAERCRKKNDPSNLFSKTPGSKNERLFQGHNTSFFLCFC